MASKLPKERLPIGELNELWFNLSWLISWLFSILESDEKFVGSIAFCINWIRDWEIYYHC